MEEQSCNPFCRSRLNLPFAPFGLFGFIIVDVVAGLRDTIGKLGDCPIQKPPLHSGPFQPRARAQCWQVTALRFPCQKASSRSSQV